MNKTLFVNFYFLLFSEFLKQFLHYIDRFDDKRGNRHIQEEACNVQIRIDLTQFLKEHWIE